MKGEELEREAIKSYDNSTSGQDLHCGSKVMMPPERGRAKIRPEFIDPYLKIVSYT